MRPAVRADYRGGVCQIRLAAPASGNALTLSMIRDLTKSLEQATAADSCRVICLSAEGPEFCRGLDLEAAFGDGRQPRTEVWQAFIACLTLIRQSDRPVIACVAGNVTGGGLGLMAACDLVLARQDVVFMLPEVIVGMIPALIAPFLLRRLTPARVQYLALSTRGISASEAGACGLVDQVVETDMEKALEIQLRRLFRSSPRALAETKRYLQQLAEQSFEQQTRLAVQQLASWLGQEGTVENLQAFVEGMCPPWFEQYRGQHVESCEHSSR